MATLIRTNGTTKQIEPKNGTDFKLEELQKYVGGYIDIIRLNNGEILVVNDEGKYTEDPNEAATKIALYHAAIFDWDYISGDVVHCKDEQVQ